MTSFPIGNDEVERLSCEVWESMLNLPLTRFSVESVALRPEIASCVQICGTWSGTVLLEFGSGLARSAAAAFLGVPEPEVDEDAIRDAAGELANITAGSVKGLLQSPTQLSLPTVVTGEDFKLKIRNGHKLLSIQLQQQGRPLMVSIFEADTLMPS